jgi:hypothetical protein
MTWATTQHRLAEAGGTKVYWEATQARLPSDDIKYRPDSTILSRHQCLGQTDDDYITWGTVKGDITFTFIWAHSTATTDIGYVLTWMAARFMGTYVLTYTDEQYPSGTTVEIMNFEATLLEGYAEPTYQCTITLKRVSGT